MNRTSQPKVMSLEKATKYLVECGIDKFFMVYSVSKQEATLYSRVSSTRKNILIEVVR